MAKLRGPLLSFGAIGRFGKNLVIRRHGKDHIAETYPHPRDAKTPAQLSWRHMYQKAVALWHALSDEEKADWERLATPRHMTGYAWFLSQCLKPNPGIYLPLQGGSMQGAVAMNFNRITTLPPPDSPNDPSRLADLLSHASQLESVHWADAYGILSFPNQSAAHAYPLTQQTIPNETSTKIEFTAEDYDIQNEYDHLATYIFTPKTTGLYLAITGAGFQTPLSGHYYATYIQKNDVVIVQQGLHASSTTTIRPLSTCVASLTPDDSLHGGAWHNHGSDVKLLGGITNTFIYIMKLA